MTHNRRLPALVAAGALTLMSPAAAYAEAPEHGALSEENYGGLSLGEGVGTFPLDSAFELMLLSEDFDIPESLEIWALSPQGDEILIGSGATESSSYQNPGSPTYPEAAVELIEVELPSSEIAGSDWYAFAAVDGDSGDLVTWQVYPVLLEGDDHSFDDDSLQQTWPVPDPQDRTSPSSTPPTLEVLTEETYGLVSIHQNEAILPLDEEITVDVQADTYADLWLLPPGGEEAVFLPARVTDSTEETIQWATQISSEEVDYTGIYGLIYVSGSEVLGWAPFGITLEGESLDAGLPGVHDSADGYADRSIWPVPDSVPGPEEEGAEEDEQAEQPEDETTEAPTEEPTEDQQPEGTDETDPAQTEQTSGDNGVNVWVVVLAIAGGALIAAGIAYLIGNRRRSS
ncbi:hypothetical protein [Nesterenkonia alkaliphila]|uniref:Uncharacterized protein n=1 Tax=Nesterenkonia alkaliphila TaxID=1463631 RepID=A0A7K1UHK9_9MICC|nr:hypothetical protein [Nesterenkonia alkaliphila]MVT25874.1 hypothetical protein [Nesterenkonia alkaliphila]GFZ76487.1 hypothetical protein GCM10011359_00490 [Nesterenkonia alkaliphila]